MHNAYLMIRNLAIGLALWATAGVAIAADLNLAPSNVGFQTPIGIDFQETSGQLVLSAFYPGGAPNNLELADPTTGNKTPFSALANLTNELKIATVRASTCLSGTTFVLGEVFTGNGNAGQIIRINPLGTVVTNPWVTLPGETALVRGSLFQDRFNAAGCDLIAVTGNEQNGTAANDNIGNVWRINSAGVPSLVATVGTHLEGVTTVPNVPAIFGPMAGRILAGAEQFTVPGGPPTYNPAGGLIVAVNPNAVDDFFTIGGPGTTGIGAHQHFLTNNAFHPEDLDVIRANAQFFGIAFRDGVILKAEATDFALRCGQILITQEFPFAGTSGLSALRWDPGTSSFITDALTANITGLPGGTTNTVQQWEHVTFTSGNDCSTTIAIVKTPDSHTFNIGDTLEWNIVVSNTGAVTAGDVKLDDPLPTTGGLTWTVFSVSAGTCNAIPASQILHCDLGDIAPAASVTVVVRSSNVGGAPAAACTQLDNTGTASASNAPSKSDDGHQSCTAPPHLKVVKTPDAGTFTQGGAVSFTIVVSNDGAAGSTATNVQLSDQLPTAGGLNWSGATVTTSQGSCSVSLTSLLTCSFGSIAAGAANAVTVTVSLATTPAAACQSQPNPHAIATADGPLSAEDAGALTCTPPQTGLIAPTQTTCQDVRDGIAATLGQINYSVSNGKIGQNINPGVFFYYAKITVPANTVVTVSETQNDAAALFQIHQGQARLYKGDCSSWTAGTENAGHTGASYTIATAGSYIISIKYDTKSIAGTSAPTSDPVTYTFTATPPGASSSASVLLKKQ